MRKERKKEETKKFGHKTKKKNKPKSAKLLAKKRNKHGFC
jgi:hypothetical protein